MTAQSHEAHTQTATSTTYRQLQEQWVSGHSGGSIWEVVAVTLVPVCGLFLYKRFASGTSRNIALTAEFACCIVSTLLAFSVLSETAVIGFGIVVVGTVVTRQLVVFAGGNATAHHSYFDDDDTDDSDNTVKRRQDDTVKRRNPFVMDYRALMMLGTCVAILAVDFPIFPRRFAKVETYGVSLMDVGVGCFVFSQGIVTGGRAQHSATMSALIRALRSTAPLLLLGLIRLFLVKSTDYQEHVSEYGVHWNFFFTLAFLPPLVTVVRAVTRDRVDHALVGIGVAACYQLALTAGGVEAWIMSSAPRVGLLAANKEGMSSLFGYIAIFFCGSRTGQIVLAKRTFVEWNVTFGRMVLVITVLWSYYAIAGQVFGAATSRRLCNAMFVLSAVAYNLTVLTACMAVELFGAGRNSAQTTILDAVNRNQLALFLIANLLTGLVNKTMYTLFASAPVAFAMMLAYLATLSAIAVALDRNNITLKFW